jgi:hypothetical protein
MSNKKRNAKKQVPTPRPPRSEPERSAPAEWLDRLDPNGERSKQMVVIGLREITKDEANDWLSQVDPTYQRSLSNFIALRYSADMNARDWVPGIPMMVFDKRGRLINGQHVLVAFVKSDLDALMVVWQINRHPNAYMAFDHNRKRSAADTLKWNGVEKPAETQSAAVVLYQYEQGFFKGKGFWTARGGDKFPSDPQIQRIVKAHPGLDKHLWKSPFKGKGFSLGALRAASYVLHSIDHEVAVKFFESLIEGINIPSSKHPIAVLRKAFMDLAEGERMRNGETLARIFKAWNSYVGGGDVSGIGTAGSGSPQLRRDETFPEPIDPSDLHPKSPKPAGPVM